LQLLHKIESLSAKIDATHLSLIESRSELHKLREDFDKHRSEESQHIHAIMNAFPERDFNDHFVFHDEKRKSAKTWGEIALDVKKKVLGGVAWALMLALAVALWEYVKNELKK
jgi:hypothetical protein